MSRSRLPYFERTRRKLRVRKKEYFGRPSKTWEAGFVSFEPYPVSVERPRRVLVYLHGGSPGCNHMGEECDKLAPDESVLLLNELPLTIRLREGMKTELPILDVMDNLGIKNCQLWSIIEHSSSLSARASDRASLGDMRLIK